MARVSRKHILQDFRTRSLLEATRKIIATEGFDAVTMERVAREAGITKGGIYLYFRNKDQLILMTLEAIALEMLREIESNVDPKANAWERLCQAIRAQLETLERHKDVLRTLLLIRWHMSDRRERKKIFYPLDTAVAAFYINEMTISTAQRRIMGLSGSSLQKDTQGLIRFMALLLRGKKHLHGSEE